MGQSLERLVSPVWSFLSSFLAEFPSGVWRVAMSTNLSWLLRPTREGAQGGAPSAIQAGASGLCRWCKFIVLRLY